MNDHNKDTDESVKTKTLHWIDALHISGSIASITGISLLAVTKSIEAITIGIVVGWILGSSILLAATMAAYLFIYKAGNEIARDTGKALSLIFLLVMVPVFLLVLIFLFKLIQEIAVPFIIVLIHGQYPV